MAAYHNNSLTMVGLDSDYPVHPYSVNNMEHEYVDNNAYGGTMPPGDVASGYPAATRSFDVLSKAYQQETDIAGTYYTAPSIYSFDAKFMKAGEIKEAGHVTPVQLDHEVAVAIKEEHEEAEDVQDAHDNVSQSLYGESEYEESRLKDRRVRKFRKLNKGGEPRKPRQPRSKLLKWDDNDWKNVVLGLIWACGDVGVHIPFDQAAQVVGPHCTAGALQQAVLKLRNKQIEEGQQIPQLKMTWTRKSKNASQADSVANGESSQGTIRKNYLTHKARTTRTSSTQSLIVKIRRAYKEEDCVLVKYANQGVEIHQGQVHEGQSGVVEYCDPGSERKRKRAVSEPSDNEPHRNAPQAPFGDPSNAPQMSFGNFSNVSQVQPGGPSNVPQVSFSNLNNVPPVQSDGSSNGPQVATGGSGGSGNPPQMPNVHANTWPAANWPAYHPDPEDGTQAPLHGRFGVSVAEMPRVHRDLSGQLGRNWMGADHQASYVHPSTANVSTNTDADLFQVHAVTEAVPTPERGPHGGYALDWNGRMPQEQNLSFDNTFLNYQYEVQYAGSVFPFELE